MNRAPRPMRWGPVPRCNADYPTFVMETTGTVASAAASFILITSSVIYSGKFE